MHVSHLAQCQTHMWVVIPINPLLCYLDSQACLHSFVSCLFNSSPQSVAGLLELFQVHRVALDGVAELKHWERPAAKPELWSGMRLSGMSWSTLLFCRWRNWRAETLSDIIPACNCLSNSVSLFLANLILFVIRNDWIVKVTCAYKSCFFSEITWSNPNDSVGALRAGVSCCRALTTLSDIQETLSEYLLDV